MGTFRPAVEDLLTLATIVTGGERGAHLDERPRVHRGPTWLVVQVMTAAVVLAVGLLVRELLGGDGGTAGAALWAVPGALLVVPFVAHLVVRPRRPLVGLAALLACGAVAAGIALLAVPSWGAWTVYGTAVTTAVLGALVLGRVSPVDGPAGREPGDRPT